MSDQIKDEVDRALEGTSEDELRQLAMDIVDGKVFTSLSLPAHEASLLATVFMPLIFMEKASVWAADSAFLYEYLDKALPSGVNGYPTFASVRKVLKTEYPTFFHYYVEYGTLKSKFLTKPVPEVI